MSWHGSRLFVCLYIYASVHLLTFACLHDEVHIFHPILLKLAQIVCMINPVKNEENLPNIMGNGTF